jgi:hypothetical protein
VRGGGLAVEGATPGEIRPGILTWSDFLKVQAILRVRTAGDPRDHRGQL